MRTKLFIIFILLSTPLFAQQILKDTLKSEISEVIVRDKAAVMSIMKLKNVEADAIYAGKKSEVILLSEMNVNLAANNARQIFSKVAGLNIFENDGGGLQLGIGGRGLNPNRVSNFNTRQNGYDISADALGYPESYYTPPADLVDRIEVVRGAASLQYGTQFGGFINFKLKSADRSKAFSLEQKNTIASFNLFTNTTSISINKNKWSSFQFYQFKRGDGWRDNSGFNQHTYFANIEYNFNEKSKIKFEQTYMHYLAQQAGGLTDAQFLNDPKASYRSRNWFKVDWSLSAMIYDYNFNSAWRLNSKTFMLNASREALGILGFINRVDPMTERDYWVDRYNNYGHETRLIHTFFVKERVSTFIVGARYYQGNTARKQGLANRNSTGNKSDFNFINPDALDYSSYTFPSKNFSAFSEFIIPISNSINITPGIRYEYISTNAKGYYNEIQRNLAGTIIYKNRVDENRNSDRQFILTGIGISKKLNEFDEFYLNISQNYRSINFNDMRVANPNFVVDPNLKDEKGYSADIGIRGNRDAKLYYDVTAFLISYEDRIGTILKSDTQSFQIYRYRTNLSNSRNVGIESLIETDLVNLISNEKHHLILRTYLNIAHIRSNYINAKDKSVEGNKVEYVPEWNIKMGLQTKYKDFSASIQYSYLTEQFSDASNAVQTSNAVSGIIPAYDVLDFSADYQYKRLKISVGVNNVLNAIYFTRRAEGYPGPGIIVSDPRSYYIGLGISL
jgi:Fe(3+) dicitrate transport protein